MRCLIVPCAARRLSLAAFSVSSSFVPLCSKLEWYRPDRGKKLVRVFLEGSTGKADLGSNVDCTFNGVYESTMRIEIKLTGNLYNEIVQDLARPHAFAAERLGFVFGRMGTLSDKGFAVLLNRYHSIPDSQYLEDLTVGARIGSEAITWAMQAIYYGRPTHEGIFLIHVHGHKGETGMSEVDSREQSKLIPGFQSVGRASAHGIIILSLNHGSSWVWLPTYKEPRRADCISVIGAPVGVFERREEK